MRSTLFLAALFACIHQSAAQSQAVGKLDYTLPAGNSIWVPPFVTEDTFSGRIDQVIYNAAQNESFISLNTDSLPYLGNHYLEIGEGAEAGLAIDVLSSTGNGVTVSGDVATMGLASAQQIIIREHLTVEELLPLGANFAPFLDTVSIFNADGTRLDIFWNSFSATWMDALGASWNTQKLLPGQGLLVFLSQELTIELGGGGKLTHVKTTPTRLEAKVGAINLVGPVNPFPGDYPLSDIGFLSDFSPFVDSASFFSSDGLFVPTETYVNEAGITTANGPIFINGLGQDSSAIQIPFRQASVVNVGSDKTIGFAPAQIGSP